MFFEFIGIICKCKCFSCLDNKHHTIVLYQCTAMKTSRGRIVKPICIYKRVKKNKTSSFYYPCHTKYTVANPTISPTLQVTKLVGAASYGCI